MRLEDYTPRQYELIRRRVEKHIEDEKYQYETGRERTTIEDFVTGQENKKNYRSIL